MDIEARVIKLFVEFFEVPKDDVNKDTILGDYMDDIQVASDFRDELEYDFEIDIEDIDTENIETIDHLVDYIQDKINE